MINGLSSSGQFMYIHGGHSNNPYVNMGNPSAGMVRYNGNSNNLEVYDGSVWQTLSGSIATVGLQSNAEAAIQWAMDKMNKELEWKKLAEDSKAVKLALANLNKAEEQLELIAILAKKEYDTEKTTS